MRFDDIAKLFCHPELLIQYKTSGSAAPLSAEIDVSDDCNLNCTFCFWRGQGSETARQMSLRDGGKIIGMLKSLGVGSLVWSGGGEPLTNPDFPAILEYACAAGMKNGLFTNGALLDSDDVADTVLRCCEWIRINLSAADRDSFVSVHGADLFGVVAENLRRLSRIKREKGYRCSVGVGMVVTPENFPLVESEIKLAESSGLDFIQLKHENSKICDSGYADFWESTFTPAAKSLLDRYGKRINIAWSNKDYPQPFDFGKCHLSFFTLIVRPNGDVAGCKIHRFNPELIFGNLLADPPNVIIARRAAAIAAFDVSAHCSFCPYKDANTLIEKMISGGDPNMDFL